MWFEFVVGSLPCTEMLFAGYSGFPSSKKPPFPILISSRTYM